MNSNLHSILKSQKEISTDIGKFSFKKSLGEGGNSYVFLFEKNEMEFAVKFLKSKDESKLSRFKDEFFCAAQIKAHDNIVNSYHFDSTEVNGEKYYIIVMRRYAQTLQNIGHLGDSTEEEKSQKGWRLFEDIFKGIHHLHANNIIHRDIKPQNIFHDEINGCYVIGDLGIAHFSADDFPKDSKTKPTEKLANFSFSAPEQVNSKSPPTRAIDIYALGQVLQWALTGTIIRGLDRKPIANSTSPQNLKNLDEIIKICLRNDPKERYQSLDEIRKHIKKLKSPPKKDYWEPLHQFDDAIRRTFPKIGEIYETSDAAQIEKFLVNFHSQCTPEDFWRMSVEGGDGTYCETKKLDSGLWLFSEYTEIAIDKLIVHKDKHHEYNNFFIFLVSPSPPFTTIDSTDKEIKREIPSEWTQDFAVLWNSRYIECSETANGYYEYNGDTLEVNRDKFADRSRHLTKYAYIVVPLGTATSNMMDRRPTERLLASVVETSTLTNESLQAYIEETRGHLSAEISMYI